jgi:protein-tyrosine phosphatase
MIKIFKILFFYIIIYDFFEGSVIKLVRPWYWPEGGQPHRADPFTWIVKNKLAASWWPEAKEIGIYKKEGIKVVINCSEFDNAREMVKHFKYYHINVPDYGLPQEKQIEHFLDICSQHAKKNEPIVVHCVAGCGRTGQFIVAWAAYNGYLPDGTDPVKWIRKLRPCSLETEDQMEFARRIAIQYKQK